MDMTVIAKCDRCGAGFIWENKPENAPLPSINRSRVKFEDGAQLVRHRYLSTFGIDEYNCAVFERSEIVAFCEKCDADYWTNFEKAAKQLASFWLAPVGEKVNAQLRP